MDDPVLIDLTKGQKYKLPVNIQHHVRIINFFAILTLKFKFFNYFKYVETNSNNISELIPHYLKQFEMDKCIIFTNMRSITFLKYFSF